MFVICSYIVVSCYSKKSTLLKPIFQSYLVYNTENPDNLKVHISRIAFSFFLTDKKKKGKNYTDDIFQKITSSLVQMICSDFFFSTSQACHVGTYLSKAKMHSQL